MEKMIYAVSAMMICCATSCTQSEKIEKPNIMVILLDDAGYNDFGFKGSKDLLTPNIDRLAADGMVFTDAHVSASVSGPSRAGILSGRYNQRCGYECNLGNKLGLGLDEETIADVFLRNGYNTSCFGKWHQGNEPEYHPNKRGFEHFYGFIAGSRSYFYRPNKDDKPGNTHNLQFNGKQLKFDGYMTDVLANAAVEYLDKQKDSDKPFMMYLAFNAVHTPLEATKEDMSRFKGHPRQKLAAMTWAVDRGIGTVVDKLKETGMYENTIIFFLSDNGGAHDNQSSNYPLKGFKGNKYEGGIRVPFFVTYGGRYKGIFEGLSSSLDIFATSIAAAGIDKSTLKNPIDGVDLMPYIKGEKTGNPHEMLFWRKERKSAVRMGDYKLINVEGIGQRLYNLKDNLGEDIDLSAENKDLCNKMTEAYKVWEKGIITPMLWDEGIWHEVNLETHRQLMNNEKVTVFTPKDLKKNEK
ncbi:sulfatase-like hydrolase/transferase [uncultured Bacteroides sp.]|uniref:sulfatase-like hydrolase/transferase n=1 Tax=uncultured Bacteroides sp. TaxID=162156 RepID=UPI0025CE93DE|nr:sulfatase-like hydrolase/transferase [uncultured Bacteroides sp.]